MPEQNTTEQLPLEAPAPKIGSGIPPELQIQEDARAIQAEIVEPSALARATGQTAAAYALEVATFKSIERARELGEIYQVQAETLATLNRSALAATDPGDWVMNRDKQSNVTGFLRAPGCIKAARYFDIHLYNWKPTGNGIFKPEKTTGEDGEYGYGAYVSIYSGKLDNRLEDVYYFISNKDDFTGMKPKGYYSGSDYGAGELRADADLKRTCYTGTMSRAIRLLLGFQRVTLATLKDAGLDMGRAAEGSGYGTSAARGAAAATGEDVTALQAELRDCLLALADNDKGEARKLLGEITEYNGRHCESVEQITNPGRFFHTWKRLAGHQTYGKAAKSWVAGLQNASKQAKDGTS